MKLEKKNNKNNKKKIKLAKLSQRRMKSFSTEKSYLDLLKVVLEIIRER